MMMFGYENEYFLRQDGKILQRLPSVNIPHDGYYVLAEVRSDPFTNPYQTLASFNAKYAELVTIVAAYGCTLANLQEYTLLSGRIETAGLHIHFSHSSEVMNIQAMMARLDRRFENLYKGIRRHPEAYRFKPYGWEYRRLPATVDLMYVTQVLAEEFYIPAKKAA